jgi:toxin ParE1/3/4
MRLTIAPLAEQDLEAIGDHIAKDNPARARSFIADVRKQCQRIARNPLGYRLRPELDEDIRSCAYGSYVIFFVASPSEVAVLRVLHGARDIPEALRSDEEGQ